MNNNNIKVETDWRDLLKKPEKLFGYSYIYFLIFIGVIGYIYISILTPLGKNSVEPFIIIDSSAFVEDIPYQSGRVLPPVDVMKAGVANSELIAKGKPLYATHCTSCHGENGLGDGPSSGLMNPKPRNFRNETGWKKGQKVSDMYVTLEEGLAQTGMPSFNYLAPEDRFAIIHYVRSLADIKLMDRNEDLKMLDATFNLSAGVNIRGQMPVSKAVDQLVSENKTRIDQTTNILNKIKRGTDKNFYFFKSLALDERKVITVFNNNLKQMKQYSNFKINVKIDPIGMGFKPQILRMSDLELSELHKFLIKNIETK